jgi:hypothetical protein
MRFPVEVQMNRLAKEHVNLMVLSGVLCGALFRTAPVAAQDGAPSKQLSNIRIFDPSGQPLKKARIAVYLTSATKAPNVSTHRTDDNGAVTFSAFTPGNYRVYVHVYNVGMHPIISAV